MNMEPIAAKAGSANLSVPQPAVKTGSPRLSPKMSSSVIAKQLSEEKQEEKTETSNRLLMKAAASDMGKANLSSARSSSTSNNPADTGSLRNRTDLGNTTIVGFMATRRLARNLISRFRQDKRPPTQQVLLPTYQLEPTKKFEVFKVEQILKTILDARMRTFRYSPRTAAMLSKILTSECKDEVKKLGLARYKIICQVTLGEKKEQSVSLSSLCVWNTDTDNMASYSWESNQCFCNATVYGIYHD